MLRGKRCSTQYLLLATLDSRISLLFLQPCHFALQVNQSSDIAEAPLVGDGYHLVVRQRNQRVLIAVETANSTLRYIIR